MSETATATPLGFTIRKLPDGLYQKIRDDGRKGYTVADEAKLWDALQAALAENAELREAAGKKGGKVK